MPVIISLVILSIYLFSTRKNTTKSYLGWSFLLTFYLVIALYEVGFPSLQEWQRLTSLNVTIFNPVMNWVPFSNGIDYSSILNILFFIPLGVALPTMWRRFNKLVPTLIYGLSFSLLIECSQLFTLHRQSDVNDLIMNTLGVFIGWLLHRYLFKWTVATLEQKNKYDWLLYPFIAIFSSFFF